MYYVLIINRHRIKRPIGLLIRIRIFLLMIINIVSIGIVMKKATPIQMKCLWKMVGEELVQT
jgi:hypothetical protein